MPKRKYNTEEEKKIAKKINAKNFYNKHKNDPEFISKRKAYFDKYYKELNNVKKEAYREYQADYAFYTRSVLTGKFEKKIIKNKELLKRLENKIFNMEAKLLNIKNKFKHLEK